MDYHYLTNDKTKEQIIVDIHKDVTHILYFSNQILLSKNIIDFGEKDIFKNMNELVNNQNFNFENFVQFISHDFKDNKKPINLICQTNDLFLNASYLNTDQLYKLIDKSIIKFINLLCEQIKKININFNTKISKILITSKTTNIGKYLAKNNFLQFKNIKVQEIQRNFLLLEDKYFLAAICIMRQVKNDLKTNNKKQTCVASYYSSEYDKKFEKSLAALTLTNSITKIVQKIIK